MWIGFVVCAALAVLMAGLTVWLVTATPAGDDPTEAVWGGGILGLCALFLGGVAWFLWRKARPPVLKNVQVSVTPAEVRRGGRVQARVTSTGSRRPDATLEVALVCTELYDIKQRVSNPNGGDYEQRVTHEHELHRQTRPVDGATVDASFDIPAEGPFSYDGDCISAIWRVRALERRPNRRDRCRDEYVWVMP